MNPYDYSNPANLSNPLSPINPIGILNPASPLYIGNTTARVEQPSAPKTNEDYFYNGVGLGVLSILTVEAVVFLIVMIIKTVME